MKKITRNTVVTLAYTLVDVDGNMVDEGREPLSYLHGGYNSIFLPVEVALHGFETDAEQLGRVVALDRVDVGVAARQGARTGFDRNSPPVWTRNPGHAPILWAQIHGRNAISWEDKFRLDVWYVDHWSFWLDVRILFMTLWKVILREGISQPGQATTEYFTGNEH